MDPVTALAIGSAVAGVGSGFFAPEGQKLGSFQDAPFSGAMRFHDPLTGQAGTVNIKPTQTLANALGTTQSMANEAARRARQPVTLANTLPSAFVQQPATFSGGGLPFDIGVTAFDAANPYYTPTAPPNGWSDAAQALLNGYRTGAGGPGVNFDSGGGGGSGTGGGGGDSGGDGNPPVEQPLPTFNDPFNMKPVTLPLPIQPPVTVIPPDAPLPAPPPYSGGGGGGPGEEPHPPSTLPDLPPDWNLIDTPPGYGKPPQTDVTGSVTYPGLLSDLQMLGLDPRLLKGKV